MRESADLLPGLHANVHPSCGHGITLMTPFMLTCRQQQQQQQA
jgi:hypothetical protein